MEQLCRICLQNGAELPIFDQDANHESIKMRLTTCLHQEIEDIEGYPKKICLLCSSSINAMCKFLQTFKENQQWIKDELKMIQKELNGECIEPFFLETCDTESESELPLAKIKLEFDIDCVEDACNIESKPDILSVKSGTNVKDKRKKKVKKEKQTKKKKNLFTLNKPAVKQKKEICCSKITKTNHIATSLLEGVYCWSSMRWSYSSKAESESSVKTKREDLRRIKKTLPKPPRKQRPKTDKQRLCDLCGGVFGDQNKLTLHKNSKHNMVELKCDVPGCKKVCSNQRYLTLHKARRHTANKTHACPICKKMFAMEKDVKKHLVLHDTNYKKKEYPCSMCDKTFKVKKSVEIHERSVHTGLRPAVCEVCDSAFFHEDYLKEHMRLHTGETPFHCPVCGRGYAQRCNMKSHLKQHRFTEVDEVVRANMKPTYLKLLKS